MIDRQNTIDNLEQNIRWIEEIECHQFPGWGNVTMAMRDAAELLKEQEPKLVRYTESTVRCPNCNKQITTKGCIHREFKYCWKCGQAVKWDD